jgi:hypothetical protein
MKMTDAILRVDPKRVAAYPRERATGIYVRALHPDPLKFAPADLAWLDKESLKTWLATAPTSAAENVLGVLLGHGKLW